MYSKVTSFPDAPVTIPTEPYQSSPYYCNGPRLSEYLQEMYNNTFAHYECALSPLLLGASADSNWAAH